MIGPLQLGNQNLNDGHSHITTRRSMVEQSFQMKIRADKTALYYSYCDCIRAYKLIVVATQDKFPKNIHYDRL